MNEIKEKFLPRWFTIWLYISIAILFAGGVSDTVTGKPPSGGVNAWAAALAILILYLILLFIWRKKEYFRKIFDESKFPFILLFILIGWFFAGFDELINWPFNPLEPGISLIADLVLTTPWYIMAHLLWYYVIRKYRFTITEALITGGFSLAIFEIGYGIANGAGAATLLGIIVFPFMVMLHGFHMVMPPLLLKNKFDKLSRKDTILKYPIGIILPAIGVLIGIQVAGLISPILG